MSLDALVGTIPDTCKDLRLNLPAVLRNATIEPAQAWCAAISSAWFIGNKELAEVLMRDAPPDLTPGHVEDAQAAAALMGMTTVYYKFRHLVGKESYTQKRAGLRMNRMSQPATTKVLFEVCALACAALSGCEACIRSHEHSLLETGLSEDQVLEIVRIAAVVNGFSTAMQLRSN